MEMPIVAQATITHKSILMDTAEVLFVTMSWRASLSLLHYPNIFIIDTNPRLLSRFHFALIKRRDFAPSPKFLQGRYLVPEGLLEAYQVFTCFASSKLIPEPEASSRLPVDEMR